MLNIYINARFLTQPVTGVQRYAIELTKSIDKMLENGEIDSTAVSFTLIAPRDCINVLPLKNINFNQVGFLSGHMWEQLELPIFTYGNLLLNFCNTGPIFKSLQLVTIHDASVYAYPDGYSKLFRIWYRLLLPILAINSVKIITVSEFSKLELIRFCKISPEKIISVYNGAPSLLTNDTDGSYLDNHDLKTLPFVLAVGSMNPNKNFHNLTRAFELLGDVQFQIVIVGGINSKVFKCNAPSLPDFINQVGYVSDGELQLLYRHATCFVYPSFYEGFGLPPLEAMAAGCPVIASNAASMPEICGDAAIYCDPSEPADIANKILLLMGDPSLRNSLRDRGFERAKQFTWLKCARETYSVIQEVVNK